MRLKGKSLLAALIGMTLFAIILAIMFNSGPVAEKTPIKFKERISVSSGKGNSNREVLSKKEIRSRIDSLLDTADFSDPIERSRFGVYLARLSLADPSCDISWFAHLLLKIDAGDRREIAMEVGENLGFEYSQKLLTKLNSKHLSAAEVNVINGLVVSMAKSEVLETLKVLHSTGIFGSSSPAHDGFA